MSFAAFDAAVPLDTQLYTMIELEGTRYGAFFNKLAGGQASISRDQALDFFRKSSLTEEQVQELYARLKGLQLLRQGDRMNESEFALGMHLIVCMTKRGLTQIPSPFPSYLFPSYLFPSLDLTPEAVPSFDFRSPTPPSETSKTSSDTPLIADAPLSFTATSPVTSSAPLTDAKSLTELVNLELRGKQHEAEVLAKVDKSETRALQSLHACVERIAQQVDALGFPVPSSARNVDALDDLRNVLTKHVHAAKQEIQSMQIDAQMRSVASEATQDEDPLKVASGLTQELMALQHQTAQLMARKADVVARLVAVKSGGSAAGSFIQQSSQSFGDSKNPAFALSKGALTVGELGTASASTTPPKHGEGNPEPSLMQSHNSASSGGWGTFGAGTPKDPPPPQSFKVKIDAPAAPNDPFGFGSAPAAGGAGAPKKSESTPDNDFAWGSFQ